MAESMTHEEPVIIIHDPEEETTSGAINICEAQEYVEVLNIIFNDFNELMKEDRKDVLIMTLWALKRHMTRTWDDMAGADEDMVISSINEPSCVTL